MNTTEFSSFFADLRKKRLGIALILALSAVGALVLCILQCHFLHTRYDTAYATYLSASLAPTVLFWIAVSVIAACLCLSFLLPKTQFAKEQDAPIASQRALWLCVSAVHAFLFVWILLTERTVFANGIATAFLQIGNLCVIAYGVIASGILPKKTAPSLLRIDMGFGVLLFLVFRIFSLYFDRTTPMTAPLKTIEIMAAISLCLYLLCALRRDLEMPLPRLQWAVTGIAALLSALCGASGIYLWVLYPHQFSAINAFSIAYFTWAILLFAELWHATASRFLRRLTDYLVFGVLTTAVNFVCYFLLTRFTPVPILIANVIACILSILFAYLVNKCFVFEEMSRHGKALICEGGAFFLSRLATLGLEELTLYLFFYVLGLNDLLGKIVAAVLVVITNYLTGRFLVFHKKEN